MKLIPAFILVILFFAGCEPQNRATKQQAVDESGAKEEGWPEQQEQDPGFSKAIAVIRPAPGNNVKGIVTFTREDKTTKIVADITGLKPGKHGIHIHEFGDISSPDGSSAGPHFSPLKHEHGAPIGQNRHEGDLGNITADASGKAHLEITDSVLTFYGSSSIIGRAVVIHEKEDDFTTQPSGNSGGRIAYGVIGIAKQ